MPAEVYVIIYDLIKPLNAGLRILGTGAFHVGVEVRGQEWGYGFSYTGAGIFSCEGQVCFGMKYRQAMLQGETVLSDDQVRELLDELRSEWIGTDYDLLTHSCCSFADVFCQSLGADPLPSWVSSLAAAGATVGGGCLSVMGEEQREMVLSKATSGEIDQRYTAESGATARASKSLPWPRQPWEEDVASFWVELGSPPSSVEAADAPGKLPKQTPNLASEVRKGLSDQHHNKKAPRLLGHQRFPNRSPATKEVPVSENLSARQDCGGCCQQ